MRFSYIKLSLLIFIIIGFFTTGLVYAGTVGSIKGTVKEGDEPVPGAIITLKTENIMARDMGAVTDAEGYYEIHHLPPGAYTVVCTAFGLEPKERSTFVVQDNIAVVNFNLAAEAAGEETIIVEETSINPIINPERSDDSTIITQKEIQSMPVAGQSFQGLMYDYVPSVVEGADDGQPHVKGGRANETSWMVDGFNATDPVTGTFGINLNLNSIESMEVITGGFNAEYGRYMSGMVNVVTKSGGDDYHGNVGLYYQNHRIDELLFGKQERITIVPWGSAASREQHLSRTFQRYDPDNLVDVPRYQNERIRPEFSFEGPIIREKLTFFASFDYLNYYDKRSWLRSNRTWEGYNSQIKFTYRLTPNDRFTLDLRKHRADIGIREKMIEEGHNRTQIQDTMIANLSYTHIFSEKTSMNFRFQYWDQFFRNSNKAKPGDQYTLEQVNITAGPNADIWEFLQKNYDPNIRGPEDLDDDRLYLAGDDYFWYHRVTVQNTFGFDVTSRVGKDHSIKVGFDFMDVLYNEQLTYTGMRYYWYFINAWYDGDSNNDPNQNNPFRAANRDDITAYYEIRREVNLPGEGDPNSEFHRIKTTSQQYAMFIQDTWRAFPPIIVNYGVRMDVYYANIPKLGELPDYPEGTSNLARPPIIGKSVVSNIRRRHDVETVDVSPRLGFSYTPNDKTKIFGNYGIFYNSTNLLYVQINDEQNAYQQRYFDQGWEWNRFQPNELKSEKTVYYQLGFDRELFDNLGMSIHGSFKDISNLLTVVDLGVSLAGTGNFETTQNIGSAKYWGVDIIFRKNLSNHWSARFSYTFSRVTGNLDFYDYLIYGEDAYNYRANKGEYYPFDWDVPHVIKLSGLYEFARIGVDVSGLFSYKSGFPYTRYHRDVHAGQYYPVFRTEKGGARTADRNALDLTVAKHFLRQSDRYDLKLWVTIYNVFNNFNVLQVYEGSGAVIEAEPRRRMEFGVDFKF